MGADALGFDGAIVPRLGRNAVTGTLGDHPVGVVAGGDDGALGKVPDRGPREGVHAVAANALGCNFPKVSPKGSLAVCDHAMSTHVGRLNVARGKVPGRGAHEGVHAVGTNALGCNFSFVGSKGIPALCDHAMSTHVGRLNIARDKVPDRTLQGGVHAVGVFPANGYGCVVAPNVVIGFACFKAMMAVFCFVNIIVIFGRQRRAA